MKSMSVRTFTYRYVNEILLYSGQFALFYLLMQIIIEGSSFLYNFGHLVLLAALIVQSGILAYWGGKISTRVAITFLVPIVYSLVEIREGFAYLLNAAHVGFWVYAIITSVLMFVKGIENNRYSRISEFILVIINVTIFIFLYFYFDTWKGARDNAELTIFNIFKHTPHFLEDPTHWFIIWGGCFLAITVALGRMEIAVLRDKIHLLFGKYIDKTVRDIIIREGSVEARRYNLCVLFSDIRDFTGLCENNDPESVTKMLNQYFEQWNILVKKHHGIVDKYIGDAIMVIFGLENASEACNSAVLCGIEMREELGELQKRLIKENLPVPSDFGVGCHYGDLIFGDIGSSERKNFSVIGDTVNIASRLESASRQVNSNILISSEVYERLDQHLKDEFLRIGLLELKGKQESIETWGRKALECAGS